MRCFKLSPILSVLVLSQCSTVDHLDNSSYNISPIPSAKIASSRAFSEQPMNLFELEKEANLVVGYSIDHKIDIGVGRVSGDFREEVINFDKEQLVSFFDDQRKKDLIVVIVAKHTWTDHEVSEISLELRDYFIARGYKHISIQQGLGGGRGLHLDHKS